MAELPPFAGDERLRSALSGFAGLRQAIVFGSVAGGRARADSDIDLAVQSDRTLGAEQRVALIEAVAEATGRPVDLVDLRTVGEPLLGQILKSGRRLLGDDAGYAELLRRHVFEAEDFLAYLERLLDERRRAWIG